MLNCTVLCLYYYTYTFCQPVLWFVLHTLYSTLCTLYTLSTLSLLYLLYLLYLYSIYSIYSIYSPTLLYSTLLYSSIWYCTVPYHTILCTALHIFQFYIWSTQWPNLAEHGLVALAITHFGLVLGNSVHPSFWIRPPKDCERVLQKETDHER